MHCYHLVSNVSRPDWSLICHSHRQKNPKVPQLLFFSPLPPPFFSSQSFFHHPLQVCDRFQTGWEWRTMCCDPRYCPPAQRLVPTPSPSRPWGAGPPPLPPASLSTPPPPPESIALRHHTNDPLKSMHHNNAPPTMAGHVVQDWEGARIRWRVVTGKYEIWTGKQKKENKYRNRI